MAANTIIRTNVLALNSHRNLGMVGNNQARASQRLSSGFRINNAADDAAGLGISEKMRAQIRGLDQASRNAQDGISLIQTAEGALGTVNEILIRVRELTIQAANDTNVGGTGAQSDRLRIQDEIDQLMAEIDSIATRTEFNTRNLLDGSLSSQGVITGGTWETYQTFNMTGSAQITTLDQMLNFRAGTEFSGSFGQLLADIGVNFHGASAEDWIAQTVARYNMTGFASAITRNIQESIGRQLGLTGERLLTSINNGDINTTSHVTNFIFDRTGLSFASVTAMLDQFVRNLQVDSFFANGGTGMPGQGGASQGTWVTETRPLPGGGSIEISTYARFDSWSDFVSANSSMANVNVVQLQATFGGERMWEALARNGFNGANSSYSFASIRNMFASLGGGSSPLPGFQGGWGSVHNPGNVTAGGGFGSSWNGVWGNGQTNMLHFLTNTAHDGTNWLAVVMRDNNNFLQNSARFNLADAGEGRFATVTAMFQAFVDRYMTSTGEWETRDRWVGDEATRQFGNSLWFHTGANANQGVEVEIGSVSTGSLFGREGANHSEERRIIDVTDISGFRVQAGDGSNFGAEIAGNPASDLIEALDSALATATRQRSLLGAVQNRLEFNIENVNVASENLSAANSRIRDADMAREMMSLTQANVLQQAAISMLAQANQAPQNVLQLLG